MTKFGYIKEKSTAQTRYLKAKGIASQNIFTKQLNKLLSTIQPGDSIYVANLEQLGSSLISILKLIDQLTENDITVIVDHLTFNKSTASGRHELNAMRIYAEFESKARPKRRHHRTKITPKLIKEINTFKATHTQKATAKHFGISVSTVRKY